MVVKKKIPDGFGHPVRCDIADGAFLRLRAKKACSPAAKSENTKFVRAGEEWVVTETTRLHGLFLSEGAPSRRRQVYCLSLTINGVETGGD